MLYVGKSKEHLHAPSHSTSQHHGLWMAIPSWEHSLCMASITTHSHCLPPIASGNLVSFPALCSNFPMIKLQDWGLHLLLSSILILSPGDHFPFHGFKSYLWACDTLNSKLSSNYLLHISTRLSISIPNVIYPK